jgi:hypothetical protein
VLVAQECRLEEAVVKLAEAKVDLQSNVVLIGRKRYRFSEHWQNGERRWTRDSAKFVTNGIKRYPFDEAEDDMAELEAAGFRPVKIRVRDTKKIKLLDRLFDEEQKQADNRRAIEKAAERERQHRYLEQCEKQQSDGGEGEEEQSAETEGDESDEEDTRTTAKASARLSIRFTDVGSGHAFDFYVSRSKKDSRLYFVAVYQGKKPLRYVNVKPQAILDFKQKVAALSITG